MSTNPIQDCGLRAQQAEAHADAYEAWKRNMLDVVDERIESYCNASPEVVPETSHLEIMPLPESSPLDALAVTEILENILRQAKHGTILLALSNSFQWRAVALRLMKPCKPEDDSSIRYSRFKANFNHYMDEYDLCGLGSKAAHLSRWWKRPRTAELNDLQERVSKSGERPTDPSKNIEILYITARLHQTRNCLGRGSSLPRASEENLSMSNQKIRSEKKRSVRTRQTPEWVSNPVTWRLPGHWHRYRSRWLDFSELDVNPYFASLFSKRI